MKPRNKKQERLVEWSHSLPALTERQMQYAIKRCFESVDNYVFVHRCYAYCPATGKVWKGGKMVDVQGWTTCLTPQTSYKQKKVIHTREMHERAYFMILTTRHGYQIARWFLVERWVCVDWGREVKHTVSYSWNDIGVEWLSQDGKSWSVERPRATFNSYNIDVWSCGDMELRRYSSFARFYSPRVVLVQSVLPILKRNGWTKELNDRFASFPLIFMQALIADNKFESVIKCGHYGVATDYLLQSDYYLKGISCVKLTILVKYATILKLANRKHIVFDELSKWSDIKDYYDDLVFLGMDVHNPAIMFPDDFQEVHIKISRRAYKVRQERWRRETELKHYRDMLERAEYDRRTKEWVAKYTQMFQTLDIKCGEFEILPLITTSDFKAEADYQHHCIETYYGKRDTLLLSITHNGRKAETAEICLLKNGYVVQCRGKLNNPTEWHEKILTLLDSHMDAFIKRYRNVINAKRIVGLPAPMSMYQAA